MADFFGHPPQWLLLRTFVIFRSCAHCSGILRICKVPRKVYQTLLWEGSPIICLLRQQSHLLKFVTEQSSVSVYDCYPGQEFFSESTENTYFLYFGFPVSSWRWLVAQRYMEVEKHCFQSLVIRNLKKTRLLWDNTRYPKGQEWRINLFLNYILVTIVKNTQNIFFNLQTPL